MSGLQIKPRGRPRKNPIQKPQDKRSDSQVMEDLQDRFSMLSKLTEASIHQNIRSLVISGAPGVGKTYSVMDVLESHPTARFESVAGALSGVELYKLGFRNRHEGSVIVLDDADGIFASEDALNVLKAMCDSSQVRQVSWLKDSATLKQDEIPQTYKFRGSIIFITNIDLAYEAAHGKSKFTPHFEALMSRSLYLDLTLHSRKAIAMWIDHVAKEGRMLAREGIFGDLAEDILKFVAKHREDFRELSLRTVLKLAQLAKTSPEEWQRMGRVLLCKM